MELPTAFSELKPYEIEDCLCIYKRELQAVERNRLRPDTNPPA